MTAWQAPDLQLADGAMCRPSGLTGCILVHVPSRMVTLGDVPVASDKLEGADISFSNIGLLCVDVVPFKLTDKVIDASLSSRRKVKLEGLLRSFDDLLDGCLGHTSMVEHKIDTAQVRPIILLIAHHLRKRN